MTPRRALIVLAASIALVAAACGGADDTSPGSAAAGERTIEIEMRDNAFSPDRVSVEAGETVRFVFHNNGKVVHDAFIGDEDAQQDHEMWALVRELRPRAGHDERQQPLRSVATGSQSHQLQRGGARAASSV